MSLRFRGGRVHIPSNWRVARANKRVHAARLHYRTKIIPRMRYNAFAFQLRNRARKYNSYYRSRALAKKSWNSNMLRYRKVLGKRKR